MCNILYELVNNIVCNLSSAESRNAEHVINKCLEAKSISDDDDQAIIALIDVLASKVCQYLDIFDGLESVEAHLKEIIDIYSSAKIVPDAKKLLSHSEFSISDDLYGAALIRFLHEIKSDESNFLLRQFLKSKIQNFVSKNVLGAIAVIGIYCNDHDLEERSIRQAFPQDYHYFRPKLFSQLKYFPFNAAAAPKISVILTTYNQKGFIERALSGFFSQDFDDSVEILIADDASTDGTMEKLLFWKEKFPQQIKIISFQKNVYQQGRKTIEVALKYAQGEYIALCEGDDFWIDPRKLKIQTEILDKTPLAISTTHNFFNFDIFNMKLIEKYKARPAYIETPQKIQNANRLFWAHTLMFRKKFDTYPEEAFIPIAGDQVLTSFFGNFGVNVHIPDLFGSVQYLNPVSTWTPLGEYAKNIRRYQAKYAIKRMNERLGNFSTVKHINDKLIILEKIIDRVDILKAKKEVDDCILKAKEFTYTDLNYTII